MSERQQRVLSEPEQRLFSRFFESLKQLAIPFLLLRNYEDFPERIGHDLDLFFRRADALKVKELFLRLLAAENGKLLVIHQRDYFIDIRFVFGGNASDAIHLDIYHGSFTWHGLTYLSDEELLRSSRTYNHLPIPRPAHEAFNIFFASILWGGFYKTRYQPRIAILLASAEERAEFDRCTRRAFGGAGLPPFDPCASTFPEKAQVKRYAVRLRRTFKLHSFRKSPIHSLLGLSRHWSAELGCFLRPKGLIITLTGPDEKLSSAICAGVIERIGELFGEHQIYHLPGKRDGSRNALSGFLNLLCQWAKCWLDWPVRGWKKKGQSQLVILDRHSEDWWCHPARHGFTRIPDWLLKLLARATPHSDFTFFLLPGGSSAGSSRFGRWAKKSGRCLVVDSDQDPSAILDCIESKLVAYLRQREASV